MSMRCTLAASAAALVSISLAVGNAQATRVRAIAYSARPIADQLLPDDEVIVVRREFDTIEPEHFSTGAEIIDQTIRWAAGIAVVIFERSGGVFVDGGTWIRTKTEASVREVVKSTPRLKLLKGQRLEVSINGGELNIGKVLVRTEDVMRIVAGKPYLIFIHAGDKALGFEMIRMPLQVDHGKLISNAQTRGFDNVVDPLNGLDMAFVWSRILELPQKQ